MNHKSPFENEKIRIITEQEGEKNGATGLFIPHRQMTFTLAGAITVAFTLFLGGYFLGKRTAIEELTTHIESESFADHVYSSMCALYEKDSKGTSESDQDQETETSEPVASAASTDDEPSSDEITSNTDNTEVVAEALSTESISLTSPNTSVRYYAQLIGFGGKNGAEAYVKKMKKKGFELEIKKRVSTTARGKSVAWYQVVTAPLTSREAIEDLVDRISQEEKIKDARIISC